VSRAEEEKEDKKRKLWLYAISFAEGAIFLIFAFLHIFLTINQRKVATAFYQNQAVKTQIYGA
jgi:hypothetical protein